MSSSPPHITRVSLQLFGHIQVRIGGDSLTRLHSQRGLWLLAILALNRRPVERVRLAGILWPDSPETTALHNLRQTLADLRRALGTAAQCLVADHPRTLRLDPSYVSIDVLDFVRALAAGDAASLEHAAGLYRGPLLAGCDEPWAIEEREACGQAYLDLLERLGEYRSTAKDPAGASRWLRMAIAADPYRESAHRGLMQSLAAAGELTAATGVYRSLRERLHRDLNTEPDPMTTAAFRAIGECRPSVHINAAAPARMIRATSIAVPPNPLIGRDDDVKQIKEMLDRARLVTITGAGGIGKTRLALQVAREIDAGGDREVAFAALAAATDSALVPDTILSALGAAKTDLGRAPIEALKDYLLGRQVLLVLDNCEHLDTACAALADELLSACEHLRILATSRHALGISSESVWRVPSLALPPIICPDSKSATHDVPCFESYAAVELFIERARAVESSFRITPATAPLIAAICRRVDGIPLAIELAAARIRSLSLEEIDARLSTGLGLLSAGGAGLVDRHSTLSKAFEWSWDLLKPVERTLLRRLTVFMRGWTLTASEAVCADGEVAPDDVLDLLTSLVDKSLVVFIQAERELAEPAQSPHQSRYYLLEPIRQFAANRLTASGEHDAVHARHRDYFLGFAEEIKPRLSGVGQELWFVRLETDHDNLRTALRWCKLREEDAEKELRLAVALARFWDTHGHLREGRDHLEAAISRMTSDLPHELRASALVHAGWMAAVQNDNAAARNYYGGAIAIFEESGNLELRAEALGYLAIVVNADGDLSLARDLFHESISIRRSLGSTRLGSVLNNLACLEIQLGNDEAARGYLLESAYYCEHITNSPQQLAITLSNLADMDLRQRCFKEAEAYCASSLRTSRDCGAIVNIPDALGLMAQIARGNLHWKRTARLIGAVEALRESMGLPHINTKDVEAASGAEKALGVESYGSEINVGRHMTLDEAIEYALDNSS